MKSITSTGFPHYHILDYLSFKEINQIYHLNHSYRSQVVNTQEALEREYSHHYNMNNKKKLTDISSIISSDALTYPNTPSISLKDIIYKIVYGKIMNKILQMNRIIVFKCFILSDITINISQLCDVIQQITNSKSIMITIIENDHSSIKNSDFTSVIHCIKNQMSILDVSVSFDGKNTFGYVRNLHRFHQSLIVKQGKSYFNYQNMFYKIFNNYITNIRMSYQDFNNENLSNKDSKYIVDSFELTLAFDLQHKYELDKCMKYLSKLIVSSTIKIISFQAIDYNPICDFIIQVKPNNLSLVPYKDVNRDNCISIMNSLSSYGLDNINLVNITNYPFESIDRLITSQTQLLNLRIGGMLSEDTMKQIICFYMHNKYQLKHLSLNGRINMNREWCDLICKALQTNRFESFHIDCFFNENNSIESNEYLREIAIAFHSNNTMKSFTIRNSVRLQKDDFIEVLKAILKENNISREDILKKFKHYAII